MCHSSAKLIRASWTGNLPEELRVQACQSHEGVPKLDRRSDTARCLLRLLRALLGGVVTLATARGGSCPLAGLR
eukprot:6632450-Alexandrium_andersonii.AAC.1